MLTIPLLPLPVLFLFLVDVFRHPRDVVTYVWPDDDGRRHPWNISPSPEETIPLSSYQVPCKLSDEPVCCRHDHRVTDDV